MQEYNAEFLERLKLEKPRSFEGSLNKILRTLKSEKAEETTLESVLRSPDPEQALRKLSTLKEKLDLSELFSKYPGSIRPLVKLFGSSNFLADILIREEPLLMKIVSGGHFYARMDKQTHLENLREMLLGDSELFTVQSKLKFYKYSELARITYLNLGGSLSVMEAAAELSSLADAIVEAALSSAIGLLSYQDAAETPAEGVQFAVIGLGKLGGQELNYSSDIDLIYIYDTPKVTKEEDWQKLKGYYTKLAGLLTTILSTRSSEGFLYRTDLRLRPDGEKGEICLPLQKSLRYYEYAGRTWERAVFLRGRLIAGSKSVWDRFSRSMNPFVFKKYLDFSTIDDLREMKRKLARESSSIDPSVIDIKNGMGGIREIEFFLHALSLINGGKKPQILSNNTLATLKLMKEAAVIDGGTASLLEASYVFLRKVEHALQMRDELQVSKLPGDEIRLKRIAVSADEGMADEPSIADSFLKVLKGHMKGAHAVYSSLFESGHGTKDHLTKEVMFLLTGGDRDRGQMLEILRKASFSDPENSLKNLTELKGLFPELKFSSKARELLRKMLPDTIFFILKAPDPDMALSNFARFARSLRMHASYFALLKENPNTLKLIVDLFGTSRFLSTFLINHPETMDALVLKGHSRNAKSPDELSSELRLLLSAADGLEERLNILRRFNNQEILRVAINEIFKSLDCTDASRELANIADTVIRWVLVIATRECFQGSGSLEETERLIDSDGMPFAIMALGKLGRREFGYNSDLDLIFIHDPDRGSPIQGLTGESFTRLAQKIISFLSLSTEEGHLYRVDMRLRPSGSQGTLVTPLRSFLAYHYAKATGWERQAMLKARLVAGSRSLFNDSYASIEKGLFGGDPEVLRTELRKIREELKKSSKEKRGHTCDLKLGGGGLIELEFSLHFLAIKNRLSRPSSDPVDTLGLIDELSCRGCIDQETAAKSRDAYLFLTRLEHAIRFVKDRPQNHFARDDRDLHKIAKSLSSEYDCEGLFEEFSRHTGSIGSFYANTFLED